MELLLNLLWLALALPAVLIWRHDLASTRSPGRFCRFRSLVLLSCLLALLFPIVSATDDLHPIRAEIEESSPSKRVVKQSAGSQFPVWNHAGAPPAQLLQVAEFRNKSEMLGLVSTYLPDIPERVSASTIDGRAPPIL
jgi:hypothetical protein